MRALAEAYGWPPDVCGRLTVAQVMMYLDGDKGGSAEREDDWSQFGLYRDGNSLKGPAGAMERYVEYRKQLKEGER